MNWLHEVEKVAAADGRDFNEVLKDMWTYYQSLKGGSEMLEIVWLMEQSRVSDRPINIPAIPFQKLMEIIQSNIGTSRGWLEKR